MFKTIPMIAQTSDTIIFFLSRKNKWSQIYISISNWPTITISCFHTAGLQVEIFHTHSFNLYWLQIFIVAMYPVNSWLYERKASNCLPMFSVVLQWFSKCVRGEINLFVGLFCRTGFPRDLPRRLAKDRSAQLARRDSERDEQMQSELLRARRISDENVREIIFDRVHWGRVCVRGWRCEWRRWSCLTSQLSVASEKLWSAYIRVDAFSHFNTTDQSWRCVNEL